MLKREVELEGEDEEDGVDFMVRLIGTMMMMS
jgi:hypothetical protein